MIGVGGSVKAGHSLGGGKQNDASGHFSSTIVLAVITISILTLLCLLFFDPLIKIINTNQELSQFVREYLRTILWFYPVLMINIVFSIFMRTQGNPGLSLLFGVGGKHAEYYFGLPYGHLD